MDTIWILNLGGIAGYTYGAIENCYFTGSISSNPNKAGNKAIGGIAGAVNMLGGILKNSYTIGTVTGPADRYRQRHRHQQRHGRKHLCT